MKPDTSDIIELLDKISNNKTRKEKEMHYTYEIVRNWNKINIIYLNILKKNRKPSLDKTLGFFLIYRVKWEKATLNDLLSNLSKLIIMKNKKNFILQNIIIRFIKDIEKFSWEILFLQLTPDAILSLQTATPSFVIDRLKDYLPYEEIRKNLEFMYKPISELNHTVRLNEPKNNQERKKLIFEMFTSQHIKVVPDIHYDYLLIVPGTKKRNIVQSEFYQRGDLIFQNKASVVPIELLNPQQGDLIWDMCSAPGLKSTLIAQKSRNNVKIIASDFNITRVSSMLSIIRNLGSKNIYVLNCDSINPPFRTDIQFDKILLDPPCTGSGTFSSRPELKWRQNFSFLNQNVSLQAKLVKRSLDYLKNEGILVYSTCSLYFEEGEAQILKIIKDFKPMFLPKWISKSYPVNGQSLDGTGRLFPSIHHSQGFFVAKLQKTK